MQYRFGAYTRAQRMALLFLVLVATAGCWLAGRIFLLGEATLPVIKAAAMLRNERAAEDAKNFRPPPASFAFDPNTVSAAELVSLGLSEKQAAGWLKFRGKRSNAFRAPEDIGKLYVLSEEDKTRLIPLAYVREQTGRSSRSTARQVQGFVFDPNTVGAADLERLGLSPKQAAAFVKYRSSSKYGRAFRKPEDLRRLGTMSDQQKDHLIRFAEIPPEEPSPTTPPQRFSFDPNTISADSFALLGFPNWQAKSLLRYRGDRPVTFRRATDLRRVKSLDSALVEAVIPLIDIAPQPYNAPAAAQNTPARPTTYSYRPKTPLPPPGSFDINSSDTSAWQALPGIGSYRAMRIVRYRDALGGFYSVDQVATTRGLPDSTFAAITAFLKSSPVYRPMAINKVSYEVLKKHPYINRNLANSIVNNRDKAGRFNGPEDLKRLRLIKASELPRLIPYFSFE
ncbi:helix-hairpin-helix domain-containing protein [Neolewinella persica]|uniref:helix-hairpin-helix domain-containing protein n=1 Tax=Neolewinella persica TaxID=70998 RepID=UPI00036F98FA|nr:helix-hairpin-helix domain-containing protein [Neolewinella persica]